MMNPEQLRLVTPDELSLVERGLADFSAWFNAVPKVRPHQFLGQPDDISTVDWVFYELGGSLWHRDQGLAMTCAWGNVLVRNFGFQWSVLGPPRDFRDYLLHHPEGNLLFPWLRLWEAVFNPGPQYLALQSVWLRILTEKEVFSSLPIGWYPAINAIRGEPLGWPVEAVQLLANCFEERPETFFEEFGMEPYDWKAESDWDLILRRLRFSQQFKHRKR